MYNVHCTNLPPIMLTDHNVYDLLKVLNKKGYEIPLRARLLVDNNLKDENKKIVGDGVNIKHELELDRRNVYKSYYGDDWHRMLTIAHSMYCDKGEQLETTIDLLLKDLDEQKKKNDSD